MAIDRISPEEVQAQVEQGYQRQDRIDRLVRIGAGVQSYGCAICKKVDSNRRPGWEPAVETAQGPVHPECLKLAPEANRDKRHD